MYSIRLDNPEDRRRLKKIMRQMMIKKDLTVKDLSEMTGYSVSTIYHFFSDKDRINKFITSELCNLLEITVGGRK